MLMKTNDGSKADDGAVVNGPPRQRVLNLVVPEATYTVPTDRGSRYVRSIQIGFSVRLVRESPAVLRTTRYRTPEGPIHSEEIVYEVRLGASETIQIEVARTPSNDAAGAGFVASARKRLPRGSKKKNKPSRPRRGR